MSSLKICPSCKWEFPISYKRTKCKFCNTPFDIHKCSRCGIVKKNTEYYYYKSGIHKGLMDNVCKVCTAEKKRLYDKEHREEMNARNMRFFNRNKENVGIMYEEWKILVDVPFKPLTETQWLRACQYFGGCAICGNKHIETRGFLVSPKHGGGYTPWNVYPKCGECSTHTRGLENPFAWLDPIYGSKMKPKISRENSERLVNYLKQQIER